MDFETAADVKREEERRVSIFVLSCLDAGILKRLIDAIQHISHTKNKQAYLFRRQFTWAPQGDLDGLRDGCETNQM